MEELEEKFRKAEEEKKERQKDNESENKAN